MLTLKYYRQTSNTSHTVVDNKITDHTDVIGTSPVGAAPSISSFSTQHLNSVDWGKTTVRRDEKKSSFGLVWPYIRYLMVVPQYTWDPNLDFAMFGYSLLSGGSGQATNASVTSNHGPHTIFISHVISCPYGDGPAGILRRCCSRGHIRPRATYGLPRLHTWLFCQKKSKGPTRVPHGALMGPARASLLFSMPHRPRTGPYGSLAGPGCKTN